MNTEHVRKALVLVGIEGFGEDISCHLLVMSNVDMFGPGMEDGVLHQSECALVIHIQCGWRLKLDANVLEERA